jgi:hypothetical protein
MRNDAGKDKTCQSDTQTPPAQAAFDIQGSVTSAFAITVDGTSYQDIETYYTQAVGSLQDRVKTAGYPGYTVKLEASLGFLDLVAGMTVYVQTTSARGYEGMTSVGKISDLDNVKPCCRLCNKMKSEYSLEVFFSHIKKILSKSSCLTFD